MRVGLEIHVKHLGLWQVATVTQMPDVFGQVGVRIGRRERLLISRYDWAYKERPEEYYN